MAFYGVSALFESRMEKSVCLSARKSYESINWLNQFDVRTLNCGFKTKNWKTEIKKFSDILHGVGKILQLLQSERIAVLSILNDSLLQVQCKSSESKHKTYLI